MSKILLIEDDQLLSELMGQCISAANFNLISAQSAEEALPLIYEHHPDLILLDIILPGMSGLGLLLTIKSDPILKSTPVIVLSNLSDETHIEESKKLGAIDYLIKTNVRPSDIISRMEAALEGA